MGCEVTDDSTVWVDDQGRISVEDVFAAGDFTQCHNQVPIILGDGAVAGIAAHFELRDFPRDPECVEAMGPVRFEEVPRIPDDLLEQAVAFHPYD